MLSLLGRLMMRRFETNQNSEELVISRAVLHAGSRLGLTNKIIARVVGVSATSISRMSRGRYRLVRGGKPFELAALLIRLFRSLDAIVGGDEGTARSWLRSDNTVLGAAPIEKIQTIAGLLDVIAYLDARRAI